MLTYRNGSNAMRGGVDLVFSLTPGQADALGGYDAGELAEAFDTVLAAIASARGDRSKSTRPSLKGGRADSDWHEWVVRDVIALRARLRGLLNTAIRAHAAEHGSYGQLADAMGVSRATAQSRRATVLSSSGLAPDEVWVTSRPPADGVTYTDSAVITDGIAEGWAENVTDPAEINWPERQGSALIPYQVINGRPVNPCARTDIAHGRNGLGLWAENPMSDALVSASLKGMRHLLMVERADGTGWAVPGGSIDPGEPMSGYQAAIRELREETGLVADPAACQVWQPRYVPDPRASDEAWAVTLPVVIDLGAVERLPEVDGRSDARRAEWIPARSYALLAGAVAVLGGTVFPAHVDMLRDLLH